jgi:hypothetical protein
VAEPAPAERFAELCREHRLGYQNGPEGPRFPPVLGGGDWAESAGAGAVYSTTTIRPRGGEPRNLALIELDEGFRMMSRVDGVAPDEVAIGLRVMLDWVDGDPPLPVFRPAP